MDLNQNQKKVAHKSLGTTIVCASPGTGKTRTLVSRAQKKLESLPKHQSLALITYTNAGADEIYSRLSPEYIVFVGTIHRFCLDFILRPFGWIYKWNKPRIVSYNDLQCFIEENSHIDLGNRPIEELGKIKRDLFGKIDNSVEWEHINSFESVAELYFKFLNNNKLIDFNEILYRSYKIVSENDFVATSLANKFHEILIDEFQDTNIFQYEILKKINSKKRCTFFIVGDEKQQIYKFAGAIDDPFLKASKDFGARIDLLDVTYRSTNNIINAYSSLFYNHPILINDSKYKSVNCEVLINEVNNNENTNYIKNCLDHLTKTKIKLSDIAILTTSWDQAYNISRSIRYHHHIVGLGALPHRSIGTSIFHLIRCICKFLLSPKVKYLKSIRRSLNIYIDENKIIIKEENFSFIINNLISQIQSIDVSFSLDIALNILDNIFNDIFKCKHSGILDILNSIDPNEIAQWSFEKYIKTLAGVDGIMVNTIHQAKGLEFEVVFLSGINENRLPYQQFIERNGNQYIFAPLTPENLEAGRNLFYVGISRAKAKLIITHNWKPSMFINTINSSTT